MRRRPVLIAILTIAAALAACGGGNDGDRPVLTTACHYGAYCNEYEGPTLDVPSTNATCTTSGATAMSACPAEGVLGVCTRVRDQTTIRAHYYEPATVDLMRSSCIGLGDTWTTP